MGIENMALMPHPLFPFRIQTKTNDERANTNMLHIMQPWLAVTIEFIASTSETTPIVNHITRS